jgi:parvulin-like peptidyl-prolyl isomerase
MPMISAVTAGQNQEDPTVAIVGGIEIKRSEIVQPLLEGYGLNVLMNVAELELAKQEAATRHLTVTPQDITAENDRVLSALFKGASKDDYPQLMQQLLTQQRISQAEFDIFIQTNAYLHKIAEPIVQGEITEDKLQESFKAIYGETIVIRDIQLTNMEEVTEAKRRIASGESFQQVAKEMSRNTQTAPLGGEMPPFSRYSGYPDEFKDVAFALKDGEISDPVHVEGFYHLIQMVKHIPPKAVKYEDVKASLRADLTDRLMEARLKTMREQMVDRISATIKFPDPNSVLAKAYVQKKTETEQEVHGQDQIRDAMKRDEARTAAAATQQAKSPTTLPVPQTQPTTRK